MRTLRGALVGYGFIGSRGHARSYARMRERSDKVEIVAVADPCAERRAAAGEEFESLRLYDDASELLRAERAQLDFIDIAAPPAFHFPIAQQALRAGLHVLCEKPLAVNSRQIAELAGLARQTRRVLMPCHNYHHAPVIREIRAEIATGSIGEVSAVTLSTYRNTHAKGTPEWAPHWRRDVNISGGGIAMDHGSHSFYICFEWMRAYPRLITAKTACVQRQFQPTEDNFSATLSFPTGLADVRLTWTAGMRKVIYAIQGTRGGIRADDDDVEVALQYATQGPDVAQGAIDWRIERRQAHSRWMDASHADWFDGVFESFAEAIASGDFVGRHLIDAYMCLATIEAGYRSAADDCREIAIEQVPNL